MNFRDRLVFLGALCVAVTLGQEINNGSELEPPEEVKPTPTTPSLLSRLQAKVERSWNLATISLGRPTSPTQPPPRPQVTRGDYDDELSMRALSDLPLDSTVDQAIKPSDETEVKATADRGHQKRQDEGVDMELPAPGPGTLAPRAPSQGGHLEAPVADPDPAASPFPAAAPNSSQPECYRGSNGGCDYNNFERCSELGRCHCLRGYRREPETGKCLAAQYFRGTLRLANEFSPQLEDRQSVEFRSLQTQVRQVLVSGMGGQGVVGLLGVDLLGVRERGGSAEGRGALVADFQLALDKNTAPPLATLQRMYNRGLTATAYLDKDGLVKLTGTSLVLGRNASMALYLDRISEFNHCVDNTHNFCSPHAECTHSMRFFTCQCARGFVDTSSDIYRAPGERCQVPCRCRNNGSCESVKGEIVCRCPHWFLGSECEINGKELLIICTSVLAGLVVLTILLCLVCVCTSKSRSRKSSRASTVGVGTLDTSVVKLPRVWMDSQRPYDLPPRPDTRRWSYVSEPVRYVDEYMMDDYVHSETLPLPRPNNPVKKPYYSAYSNSGYSSSTLSMPPRPRHY